MNTNTMTMDTEQNDNGTGPLAYCYDSETWLLTHSERCPLDPLETGAKGEAVWLLPAFSTLVAPPEHTQGHASRWNGGEWDTIADHRGTSGYVNGEPYTIRELGPYPEGWSFTPPPVPLSEALENARAAIFNRRRQAEYGGFPFEGQRWDSEEKDELRLNSMLTMMNTTGITEFPGWKINTDVFITLTPELAARAAAGLMGHYASCFRVEAAKKAALETFAALLGEAATADAVQSWLDANLETGWPGEEG